MQKIKVIMIKIEMQFYKSKKLKKGDARVKMNRDPK